MRKRKQIKLDQALHGYEEGHSLLASSRNFSKTAQRAMVVLSDMSGPSMVPGFDSYLTGYPLPNEEVYAFARTWYAPEMKRLGCVWTHTLLIRNEDLREIADLVVINEFFRRPSRRLSKVLYEDPISVDSSYEMSEAFISGIHDIHGKIDEVTPKEHFIKNLIFYLYGDPHSPPLLLPSTESTKYERTILNVWSQQWPELRRNFTFCTGSLSKRSFNRKDFDLQVVPSKAIRQFEREIPGAKILLMEGVQSAMSHPKWVNTVTRNLLEGDSQEFRKYLWEVGDVSNARRSSYAPLTKVYDCLMATNASEITVETLIAELQGLYSSPHKGVRLKRRIFGPLRESQRSLLRDFDEPDLLRILGVTKSHKAFSPEMLEMRSRACRLWKEGNDKFFETIIHLIGTDINPLGEEILFGAADAARPNELLELSKKSLGLVFVFVERKPDLASDKRLWMGNADYQRELLGHLVKGSPKEETIDSIVKAMLDANTSTIAEDTYKHWGKPVIDALLEWFNGRTLDRKIHLCPSWVKVLRMTPEDSLSWLVKANKPNAKTIALIASQLDPHSITTQKFGTEIWLGLLDTIRSDLDYETHRTFAEFLLPFSLSKPGLGYEQLAKFSFQIIHDAVARDNLSYDSWLLLESVLPKLPWYRTWDKCERLRRGMRQMGMNTENESLK